MTSIGVNGFLDFAWIDLNTWWLDSYLGSSNSSSSNSKSWRWPRFNKAIVHLQAHFVIAPRCFLLPQVSVWLFPIHYCWIICQSIEYTRSWLLCGTGLFEVNALSLGLLLVGYGCLLHLVALGFHDRWHRRFSIEWRLTHAWIQLLRGLVLFFCWPLIIDSS